MVEALAKARAALRVACVAPALVATTMQDDLATGYADLHGRTSSRCGAGCCRTCRSAAWRSRRGRARLRVPRLRPRELRLRHHRADRRRRGHVTAARRLEGRVALVTGAASGNGRAVSRCAMPARARRRLRRPARRPLATASTTRRRRTGSTRPAARRSSRPATSRTDQVAAAVALLVVPAVRRPRRCRCDAGISLKIHDLPDEAFADYERTVAVNQIALRWARPRRRRGR